MNAKQIDYIQGNAPSLKKGESSKAQKGDEESRNIGFLLSDNTVASKHGPKQMILSGWQFI